MNYRIKNKVIYRRYRVIKNIIWSIKYISEESFKSDIMMLINITNTYTDLEYGHFKCLYDLNNYYTVLCIKEMHDRIKLEKGIIEMHKRLKLGISIEEILKYE